MGLFNFFKSKKTEPDNLEVIFQKAANDNALRLLFYRTLLKSDLFFLTLDDEKATKEYETDNENVTLHVRSLENGVVPLFASADRIF